MSQVLIGTIVIDGGLVLIMLMILGIVIKVLLTICLVLIYFIKYIITFIPIKIKKYFYGRKSLFKNLVIIMIFLVVIKVSYNICNIEYSLTTEEKIKIMFMDMNSSKNLLIDEGYIVNIGSRSVSGEQILDVTYTIGKYEWLFKFRHETIYVRQYNVNEKKSNIKLEINKNNYVVKTNDAGYSTESIEKIEEEIDDNVNNIYNEYIANTYDNGLKSKKYFWINYFEAKLDL